ncbi:MAG: hypothetical protein DMF78_02420 [Acidobacteria bacterium]|nr:MAG: hypothetical protein DMF78_02420 [Acidobacteriota bacterium]
MFSMVLTAVAPRVASACNADLREASTGQPIGSSDVSSAANFYDYGALFMDADSGDAACRGAARDRLDQKLSLELGRPNAFTEWLAGGEVYLVMATALKLRGAGLLTTTLDGRVHEVTTRYQVTKVCDGPSNNTCMDDDATAAAAYAWIAAYEGKNGRDPNAAPTYAVSNTQQYLDAAFSLTESVCIRSTGDYCNACRLSADADTLYNEIAAGQTEVLSYNGLADPNRPAFVGGENPNYGVGLLTSVAAAVTGLKVIGQDWDPLPLVRVVAQGLVREGQRRVTGAANACGVRWSATCYSPRFGCAQDIDCGDPDKGGRYNPAMYPIFDFVSRKLPYRDPLYLAGFTFGCFDESFFNPQDGFFNDARLAVYRDLAWRWFDTPPSFEPPDTVPPRIWVDIPQYYQTVTGSTNFYGWAIDAVSDVVGISFSIDGRPLSSIGYGGARPDVCATLGIVKPYGCYVGWGGFVDTTAFANGVHTLSVTAADASGNRDTYTRVFVIDNPLPPSGPACGARPAAGVGNSNAFNAGYYDYLCGYYKYSYGYDYGYCSLAVASASSAGVSTAGTGTCSGGTVYNYYAGLYDYYCRYYEYNGYGYDYGSYCYWSSYYASTGGCTGCGQSTPPACQGTARTIWVQPQWRAGFGPLNSLVLAGSASATGSCPSSGVDLYWRTGGGSWHQVPYSAPVGADGIWYNSIENADPSAVYETYVTYHGGPASYCTYDGRNDIVWCP